MNKKMRLFPKIVMVLFLVTILLFTSCASRSSLVGEYRGTEGSYLKLNSDGTCYYSEGGGVSEGRWYMKNNTLFLEVDIYDFLLCASIDTDGGFLLECTGAIYSSWSNEYFSKIN